MGNQLCIAWSGEGEGFPNIVPVMFNPDGSIWFDSDRKRILEPFNASAGVGISQADNGQIAMMWGLDHDPPTLIGSALDEGLDTIRELVSLQNATQTPALGFWIRTVYMAWTGLDRRLRAAGLELNDLGWSFSAENTFVSQETSPYAPALAWCPVPNASYMAWTGEGDGELNIMHCPGGSWQDPTPLRPDFSSGTKRTYSEETTSTSASACWRSALTTFPSSTSASRVTPPRISRR